MRLNTMCSLAIAALLAMQSAAVFADDAATAVGANGVVINLEGDFYNPNLTQILQESPATIENQRGTNIIIDGTSRGYVTHTNHPLGREEILTDMYAFGHSQRFDSAMGNSVWRN